MRNLKNIVCSVSEIGATAIAWDVTTHAFICAEGPSISENSSVAIRLWRLANSQGQQPQISEIVTWDVDSPLANPLDDKILCLHYLVDIATICLILASGDIYVVREDASQGQTQIEIVGSVDAGITGAAWSPDEELLAISTGADTFLFMTRDFEEVTNVAFKPDDVQSSKHVSVGWGKSETQFKGKRAKALRDPTVQEHIDEGTLSPCDDGAVTISWRGDGNFVAVNSVEAGKRRIIRVYSREGTLDSVSEPVDGLGGSLSWRPAGNLIAGVQRFDDHAHIVFFERNGLRHGKFALRLSAEDLKGWGRNISLKWNNDSTVLAVSFTDRVQLWTMGNYHYYLKQEIDLGSKRNAAVTKSPIGISWHPEQPLRLVAFSGERELSLQYTFAMASGPTSVPYDSGLVNVTDGCNLKVTPLRKANVPPPMSLYDLEFVDNVVDVATNVDGTLLAALYNRGLTISRWDSNQNTFLNLPPHNIFLTSPNDTYARQITFRGPSEAFILAYSISLQRDQLYKVNIKGDHAELGPSIDFTFPVTHLMPSFDYGSVFVQSILGTVHEIEDQEVADNIINGNSGTTASLRVINVLQNPPWSTSCQWLEIWKAGEGRLICGLAGNGSLHTVTSDGQESLLARNCTSFLLTETHLIFTTSQHFLKFVHLAVNQVPEVPKDEPEIDERCRSIERGAKLITAIPSTCAIILQMPRGNLETIYPRAMVLSGIRKCVVAKDYKTAFLTCRNQRVDMNILHDYNPSQFMSDISLFIKQINKADHIDLFLSQLRDEDVCRTMYKETLRTSALVEDQSQTKDHRSADSITKSKVNRICDAFLHALSNARGTHLQNIITAHVCKSPPDLDAGLSLIGKIRTQGDEAVERAVEHICFLADVNLLYNHALGLYDLDLTLLVAQQSQKDPREYLPYLQGLQEQPDLRRKFNIDSDLGRRTRALQHLHDLNAFAELKLYAEKHELYSQAIDLYRYDEQSLNDLMKLYADYLNSRNRFKEAGIAYEFLRDYESAYLAYRAATLWRESLSCASLVPLPDAEIRALAQLLADGLTESKDFFAAATVNLEYLDDVENAARLFCKGYWFADAIRVAARRGRHELLAEAVDVGLVEGMANMTELLADCKGQIGAQIPRLRELRAKKAEDPLAFLNGVDPTAADVPDNVSIAPTDASTTGGTFLTRYTGKTTGTLATGVSRRSSKNRRREERKRAAGKKGSIYEEEYLINSIRRLIERINSVSEDVNRLIEGLLRRAMKERARAVGDAMLEVVNACRECVDEVFEVKKDLGEGETNGDYKPTGGEGVVAESLEQSWKKQEPPIVNAFEVLSLAR
ncbi:MAG: hypothetical protein M1820_000368 [Bogoriella megaspora]|nr:MAG: hypothetical protein M1820_000368 [Bogoriella megaspora]